MTWAAGLFTDAVSDDIGDATDGFGRAVGCVTGLPIYEYDTASSHPQRLLHLGLSTSLLYAAKSALRYRSRPESHLAPYVVDTGEITADGAVASGLEIAWVSGPLCVQEYLHSWVQGGAGHQSVSQDSTHRRAGFSPARVVTTTGTRAPSPGLSQGRVSTSVKVDGVRGSWPDGTRPST
jgi:phosphate-selective porin